MTPSMAFSRPAVSMSVRENWSSASAQADRQRLSLLCVTRFASESGFDYKQGRAQPCTWRRDRIGIKASIAMRSPLYKPNRILGVQSDRSGKRANLASRRRTACPFGGVAELHQDCRLMDCAALLKTDQRLALSFGSFLIRFQPSPAFTCSTLISSKYLSSTAARSCANGGEQ
jgi:hypothetical protein